MRVKNRRLSGRGRRDLNKPCFCDGYWFPHRPRSKWCHNNPNYPYDVERERTAPRYF